MAISILYLNERTSKAEPISERILYHLSLDRSFSHICADVKKRNHFLSVISDLTDDKNEILHRQEILRDFENNPTLPAVFCVILSSSKRVDNDMSCSSKVGLFSKSLIIA